MYRIKNRENKRKCIHKIIKSIENITQNENIVKWKGLTKIKIVTFSKYIGVIF